MRALREILCLSQQKLADRAGLTREEINKIESGKNKASSARIQRALAQGLALPAENFEALYSGEASPSLLLTGVPGVFAELFPGKWSASTWAAIAVAGWNVPYTSMETATQWLDTIESALRPLLPVVAASRVEPQFRRLLPELAALLAVAPSGRPPRRLTGRRGNLGIPGTRT